MGSLAGLMIVFQVCATFAQSQVPTTDRLTIAEIHLLERGDQAWARLGYDREFERLFQLCKDASDDCRSRNVATTYEELEVLRSRPDERSPITGRVYLSLKVIRLGSTEELVVGLDVASVERPSELRTWIPWVGDVGYGIPLSGLRETDKWVQVFGDALPPQAWLPRVSSAMEVDVTTIDGAIVDLSPLRARWPDGRTRVIPEGSYLIQRVTRSGIEFREEVPTDFACGQDVVVPRVMPPLLVAAPSEFFAPNGSPRFSNKYTKGC
jgi:hypothetical protein